MPRATRKAYPALLFQLVICIRDDSLRASLQQGIYALFILFQECPTENVDAEASNGVF
jgi:hypothetical protein